MAEPPATEAPIICILHGYLLEGSGSNLWTRCIIEALCRQGQDVHLMAQENHPERYPFVAQSRRYLVDGTVQIWHSQDSPYAGSCVLHKPDLGDTLPVYVWDRYEEFKRVVPMVELSDAEIDEYLDRNVRTLLRIVEENAITALHANHAVLMSVVARIVSERTGVPFSVMPHGSALEYAVKRDVRFHRMAEQALSAARRIFVHGEEMRDRVRDALPAVDGLEQKFSDLHLGVDTSQFEPVQREMRRTTIAKLMTSLTGLPRGRSAAQSEQLLSRLGPNLNEEQLIEAMNSARSYDNKTPDADLEERLAAVNWEQDPTLLFVGRLISTKGIHGVIAALPFLLEREPNLRLLIVGHGPLREVLEAMLWALRNGAGALLSMIVECGRVLEGSPEGESGGTALTQVARYFEQLHARGEFERYLDAARAHLRPENVIFAGYLTHRELRFLFPCCDAAVFPSVVKEAGPLVFLEALASGAYPLGTYFGGMKASIDTVAEALPPDAAEAMKLSPNPEHTVADLIRNVPVALAAGERYTETLFRLARDRFDWSSVALKLNRELEAM